MRTEVDCMPHIFRLGQYLPNNKIAPGVGALNRFLAFPRPPPLPCQVCRWRLNLVLIQNIRNVAQAVSLDR